MLEINALTEQEMYATIPIRLADARRKLQIAVGDLALYGVYYSDATDAGILSYGETLRNRVEELSADVSFLEVMLLMKEEVLGDEQNTKYN